MFLISNKEMEQLEEIRIKLNKTSYVYHSPETSMLYRIIHRKRGFKYIVKHFLNKG